MHRTAIAAALLVGTALACGGAATHISTVPLQAAAQQADDFKWTGRIAEGKSLEIRGINGGIRAELAPDRQAEVVAHKTARRGDVDAVKIVVDERDGNVRVCAVYPRSGWGSSRRWRDRDSDDSTDACEGRRERRAWSRDNDVKVEFTVRVPDNVRFVGRTVNGAVHVTSVKSDVEAFTVNGGIRLSTSGSASARTVNGSIDASIGSGSNAKHLEFRTVNGSVSLALPSNFGADLRASTLNGGVTSGLPLTLRTTGHRGRRVTGTIGSGGRDLEIGTVNGSIDLRTH